MVEDAKAGRIKSIVIKDFSRFGRDYLEVGNYLEKILPVLGIRIISINDGFDSINSSGFTGGMSVALKNMLNAMYSRVFRFLSVLRRLVQKVLVFLSMIRKEKLQMHTGK